MATEVVMPRLSDTMDSGKIARWLKQEGDQVRRGETIAEIETDKANMEMEAYATGILARITVAEGQSAGVGQPIAVIARDEEEARQLQGEGGSAQQAEQPQESEAPAEQPVQEGAQETPAPGGEGLAAVEVQENQEQPAIPIDQQKAPAAPTAQGPEGQAPRAPGVEVENRPVGRPEAEEEAGRVKASPLARRMASEHDINLRDLTGTGPGGRVTKDDVQAFLNASPIQQPSAAARAQETPAAPQPQPQPAPATAEAPREAPPPAQPAAPAPQAAQPAAAGGRAGQRVEMTRMQTTIARRMTEARFSKPDFVLTLEIDMTEARRLLQQIGSTEAAPKVGPNDLVIKAAAMALTQHRDVNAGWEDDGIVRYGRINVGFAVAIEGGLIVPVVFDADKKSLGQIATETKGLIERARSGKLAPSEYENGTFTVSNLGMYGIDQFTPIMNPPEACIMGIGAMTQKPVVLDGNIAVRDRMRVDLACDHRVINGVQGAEFLATFRQMLEQPMLVVL